MLELALALVGAGLGLRLWSWRTLRACGMSFEQFMRGGPPPIPRTREGPYRWLAHPAYVGSSLLIAGVGMLALGPGGFVLALPSVPVYVWRVQLEKA